MGDILSSLPDGETLTSTLGLDNAIRQEVSSRGGTKEEADKAIAANNAINIGWRRIYGLETNESPDDTTAAYRLAGRRRWGRRGQGGGRWFI